MGRGTVDLRTIMGAMFIQHALNLTDRSTIEMISENIYMQSFVGLSSFQTSPIFDHSLLSIFRQRLGEQRGKELNELMVGYAYDNGDIKHRKSRKPTGDDDNKGEGSVKDKDQDEKSENKEVLENRGTVKIDATVIPQNITYPKDAKLLNHSREISEKIIDVLYEATRELLVNKPRTYRREARKKWLHFSKNRRANKKTIGKQLKAQLSYLKRNLNHIDNMIDLVLKSGIPFKFPEMLRKKMYVISEVYRQQQHMYDDGRRSVSDRIVSISQPWVRPIVRGKAGKAVEFGAKVNLSLTES